MRKTHYFTFSSGKTALEVTEENGEYSLAFFNRDGECIGHMDTDQFNITQEPNEKTAWEVKQVEDYSPAVR